MNKQTSLFRVGNRFGKLIPNPTEEMATQGATGQLKPVNTPFLHQRAASRANSAIELEKFKKSGRHIPQKNRIKAFLFANQGSTLDEISWGTGITQKSTITGRFEDIRSEGFDLLDNKGRWSVRKRKTGI